MKQQYDVIIIGGSYAGLAAAMALGRALKQVLIIDSGEPCNAQTPRSHNFLTQDGSTPVEIATVAKQQVARYASVTFFSGVAINATKTQQGFEIRVASGELFDAGKLIFATGIQDMLPAIAGMAECWGISVLHCPFCHGYEVRNEKTGVLNNGSDGYELAGLIANWTPNLTLFTNGPSTLSAAQASKLLDHGIPIVEKEIRELDHVQGRLRQVVFADGSTLALKAAYVRSPFRQVCPLPGSLGCALTEEGYIEVDAFQQTTVPGVFACGDNTSRMRTVANAVAAGTTAGMVLSRQLIMQAF